MKLPNENAASTKHCHDDSSKAVEVRLWHVESPSDAATAARVMIALRDTSVFFVTRPLSGSPRNSVA